MEIDELEKKITSTLCWKMSLSSKELFHSNFLEYIAQSHKPLFKNILMLYDTEEICDNCIGKREWKHIDLAFCCSNKEACCTNCDKKFGKEKVCLIIENKVKSIPYLEQLQRYSKYGGSDTKYLLLTMINPFEDESIEVKFQEEPKTWQIITYKEFSEKFTEALALYACDCRCPDKDSLNYKILEDYRDFINFLPQYIEKHKIKDFKKSKIGNLYNKKIKENNLRLYDVIFKLRYSQVAIELENKLKKELKRESKWREVKVTRHWEKGSFNNIYVGVSYPQAGPLVEIRKRINKEWFYQLQIQNDFLLRYIVNEDNKGLKDYDKKEELWEQFTSGTSVQNQRIKSLLDKDGYIKHREKKKKFYSFNGFMYRKWAINENLDELMNIMVKEITGLL